MVINKYYTNINSGHIVLILEDGESIGWHAKQNKIITKGFRFDRPHTWRESTLIELGWFTQCMAFRSQAIDMELDLMQFKIKQVEESIERIRNWEPEPIKKIQCIGGVRPGDCDCDYCVSLR